MKRAKKANKKARTSRPAHKTRPKPQRPKLKATSAKPAVIVRNFGESSGTYRAALIGLGVALFVITVVINLLARMVVHRAEIRFKGAAA